MNEYQKIFLTFFYTGLSPIAPGTVGTIASIPLGLLNLNYFGLLSLISLTILVTIIAIKVTDNYEKNTGIHDNQKIVIDETVGVWITIAITSIFINYNLLKEIFINNKNFLNYL